MLNAFAKVFLLFSLFGGVPSVVHAENSTYQNFAQALDKFDADLKSKRVSGLENLAIRDVSFNENLPADLQEKAEALISKQIVETARTRLVHCIACRTRNKKGSETSPEKLKQMALLAHIQNFLDVSIQEDADHQKLNLNFKIVSVKKNSLVWEKAYFSGVENEPILAIANQEPKKTPLDHNSESKDQNISSRVAAEAKSSNSSASNRVGSSEKIKSSSVSSKFFTWLPFVYGVAAPHAPGRDLISEGVGFHLQHTYSSAGDSNGNPNQNSGRTFGIIVATEFSVPANLSLLFSHGWIFSAHTLQAEAGVEWSAGEALLLRASDQWRFTPDFFLQPFVGYRFKDKSFHGVEGGLGFGFVF